MNIEFSVVIVSILIILAIAVPLYLLSRSGNSAHSRLKSAFKKDLITNSMNVSQQDEWSGRMIAVDDENGKLLFVRNHNGVISSTLIDLKLIKDILLETNRDNDVELVFENKTADPHRLLFFSGADDNLANEVIFRSIAIRWHIKLRQKWKVVKKRTY